MVVLSGMQSDFYSALVYGVDKFPQAIREHVITEVPVLSATVLEWCETAWQHHTVGGAYFPGNLARASTGWSTQQVYRISGEYCIFL